jgi:hypothetical protein
MPNTMPYLGSIAKKILPTLLLSDFSISGLCSLSNNLLEQ